MILYSQVQGEQYACFRLQFRQDRREIQEEFAHKGAIDHIRILSAQYRDSYSGLADHHKDSAVPLPQETAAANASADADAAGSAGATDSADVIVIYIISYA